MVVNKDSHHGHTVNISLYTDRTVGDVVLVSRGRKGSHIYCLYDDIENKIKPFKMFNHHPWRPMWMVPHLTPNVRQKGLLDHLVECHHLVEFHGLHHSVRVILA